MELTYLILGIVFTAVIFGQIAHFSSVSKIKALRKFFMSITAGDIAANIMWLCILLLSISYGFQKVFNDEVSETSILIQPLFLLIMLTVIILVLTQYNLHEFVKNKWKIITPIATFVGIAFSIYVNVYVDAEIFRYTQLNANNFPNAQKLIFFCLAPFFAIIFSLYGILTFYFFHAFHIFIKQIRNFNYLNSLIRNIVYVIRGEKINKEQNNDEKVDVALLIGLIVLIFVLPNMLSSFVSEKHIDLDKIIADTLVFSSYHVKGYESCDNIIDETIIISFIKNNQISAVKPIEKKGYRFFVDNCERKDTFKLPNNN
ncbi:hypothetical protein [Thalassotalea sp. PP2-459]|uniref:hypothetical protein n=1 Tax=Thalassotalea sp. PP2-459 TaxID=1742724 RepID=UPI00094317DF|nr:hypothetical protein [Thalassotalea sp. PP2-459]OKY24973.1 hypothetical protein BI291_04450 [Thalassotalea sp. PP2-459]